MQLYLWGGGAISITTGALVIRDSIFDTNNIGISVSGGVMASRISLIFLPCSGGGHATFFDAPLFVQYRSKWVQICRER
jgi:hypothetical protein